MLPSLTGPSPETEEERDHSHGRGTISLLVPSPGLAGRWLTIIFVTLRRAVGEGDLQPLLRAFTLELNAVLMVGTVF